MNQLPWLDTNKNIFPDPSSSLLEPNGLLALGGDLSSERLVAAYQQGIFPWYEEGQPILWWSPNPRLVLFPDELYIGRTLKKNLAKSELQITYDQAFEEVIQACAIRNGNSTETWITEEMMQAYIKLHNKGIAHSVEAWDQGKLVGGLYGLSVGKVFCGESMFSLQSNASKIAFVHWAQQLQKQGCELIDCQIASDYLCSFGAREVSRKEFLTYLPGAGLENLEKSNSK